MYVYLLILNQTVVVYRLCVYLLCFVFLLKKKPAQNIELASETNIQLERRIVFIFTRSYVYIEKLSIYEKE